MTHTLINKFSRISMLLPLVFLFVLAMSCGEEDVALDSDEIEFYFKTSFDNMEFEIDNNNKDNLSGTIGKVESVQSTFYSGGIFASTDAKSGNFWTFAIMFYDKDPIGSQTYSGVQEFQGGFYYGVKFTFHLGSAAYTTNPDNPNSTLTLTDLNDSIVKGTFSGTLINVVTKEEVIINKGEFLVKR